MFSLMLIPKLSSRNEELCRELARSRPLRHAGAMNAMPHNLPRTLPRTHPSLLSAAPAKHAGIAIHSLTGCRLGGSENKVGVEGSRSSCLPFVTDT